MPSLTLWPWGKERSVMRRHLPVLWPLGIILKRFICNGGRCEMSSNGPSKRPKANSLCRYSVMISGCSQPEYMFADADFR